MPKRPPKAWWRGCVGSVRSHGAAVDPRRVCGAVWSRKSIAEKKVLTTMAERKRKRGKKRPTRGRVRAGQKRRTPAVRKRRRVTTRTSGAPRRRATPTRSKRTRATTKKRTVPSSIAGALPLVGDMSHAGRRRLRLAQKLGLKVR